MIEAREVERPRAVIAGIEQAQGLLREAVAHVRLRSHYEPDDPNYESLTFELDKALTLAKVSIAGAQNAESGNVEDGS